MASGYSSVVLEHLNGAMAERTVVSRAFCFTVPDGIDDESAAALPNPGVSAWLSLAFRAKLAPGENVLILATRQEFAQVTSEIRLVQVGERAGPTITLPAPRDSWCPAALWNDHQVETLKVTVHLEQEGSEC
jgi:hypothetical protein